MADTTGSVIVLTEYDLLRTKVNPGQYYATTDSRMLYLDDDNSIRRPVDATQIPTEKQRLYESFQKTTGRLYFVWETHNLYVWMNAWKLIVGNPDFPNAYQYIDGDIYSVGDMTDDVKGNGILGDGSVVIRDVNRIIKAKIYIDETNDNLVISSFLGGGIKVLPNGNMENTGALFLNPSSVNLDKVDGLGQHYNQFENVNGEMYVMYDETHKHLDTNKYSNDKHKYLVWHEGNLDATPLIEGWYLLKNIDDGAYGKTSINNDKMTKGLLLESTNPELEAKTTFGTHHKNGDGAPILNELTAEDLNDPLNNVGLYTVKDANGDLKIILLKDKDRPININYINDDDALLNKGEIVNLMNEKIYIAIKEVSTIDREVYVINDTELPKLVKEGLVISINFGETSKARNVFLKINPTGNEEEVSINLTSSVDDKPLGFVKDNIYQLIRYRDKWLVYNSEMKAGYKDNQYGTVRVTGESSDVSSFNVITDSQVDLNDDKYQYDGKYSFILDVNDKANFPEEEKYSNENGMEYLLEVNSSSGRGTGVNSNDNYIEQILTNVASGKKYVRYLNRMYRIISKYEQGTLDNNGRNVADNIRVRQIDRIKVDKNSSYKLQCTDIVNSIQVAVAKLDKTGCLGITNYMNVNNTTRIPTDNNTEYFRLTFQYQDKTNQLSPTLINNATINLIQFGFGEWEQIYDKDKLVNREKIGKEIIKLPSKNWIKSGSFYTQTFYRWDVSENTLVEGNLDIENQRKIEVSYIESFNFGFRVISETKPIEDIKMTILYTETKEV